MKLSGWLHNPSIGGEAGESRSVRAVIGHEISVQKKMKPIFAILKSESGTAGVFEQKTNCLIL